MAGRESLLELILRCKREDWTLRRFARECGMTESGLLDCCNGIVHIDGPLRRIARELCVTEREALEAAAVAGAWKSVRNKTISGFTFSLLRRGRGKP